MFKIGLMKTLGTRIAHFRKLAGLTQGDLAKRCGWASQSRVGNYESDSREPTIGDLKLIAAAVGVKFVELIAEEDARQSESKSKESNVIAADFSSKPERGLTASGDLIIPHYDVRAAMGAGQAPADYVETIRHLTLHNSYLKSRGVNYTKADNLAIITGFGQSMEGTIADGEPVIVDRGVTEFVGDGVYVFTWDNLLYIKRLQKASASEFDVISDNKLHKDRVVPVAEIIIHAKCLVAWNARKL